MSGSTEPISLFREPKAAPMKDDITVDKAKFDTLLKKMLNADPLPLAKLRGKEEPQTLAARKPKRKKS